MSTQSGIVQISDDQITLFLKWLIELSAHYYVDDQNYIRNSEDGECVFIPGDSKSNVRRPIILYSANITDPDALILNPFVEGNIGSEVKRWFYSYLGQVFCNHVRMIQKFIIRKAIEAKDKTKKSENLELSALISPWITHCDEKSIQEFDKITRPISDYLNVIYITNKRECRLNCGLLDDKIKTIHGKDIRKKFWEPILDMLKLILNTQDFSDYFVISSNLACPQLDSTLRLLYHGYAVINKYLPYLHADEMIHDSIDSIDIDYFKQNIDLLEDYRLRAKHLIVANVAKSATTPQSAVLPSIFNPMQQSVLPQAGAAPSVLPMQPNQILPNMPYNQGYGNMGFQQRPMTPLQMAVNQQSGGMNFGMMGMMHPHMQQPPMQPMNNNKGYVSYNQGYNNAPSINHQSTVNTDFTKNVNKGPFG